MLEPFGSLLQAGGADGASASAASAAADPCPSPPSAARLSMRQNSMPHAEPWFHGRISRQKVGTENSSYEMCRYTSITCHKCSHILACSLCGLQGCLKVVKGVPNQDSVCSLTRTGFSFVCVSGVCSVLFPCFWLSVPVQSIAWKDSSFRRLVKW